METLGDASKRNLAPTAGALINRSFLPSVSHLQRTCKQDRSLQGAMETFGTESGLTCVFSGDGVTQQSGGLWRPWTGAEDKTGAHKVSFDNLKY